MGLNIIYRMEKANYISEDERLYYVNIYRVQHFLHRLAKDIVVISFMNGAAMGSGVLYGLNTTFSIATEKTVWSLPEVGIGGLPDVGVVYHMNKLPHKMGNMLALTGYRLSGREVVAAGIATHFCSSERLENLKEELASLGDSPDVKNDVKEILDKYQNLSKSKGQDQEKLEKVSKLQEVTERVYKTNNIFEVRYDRFSCSDYF